MNLYNIYFVSKGTGPQTVQVEALNQGGVKAQVEARYPGAYNVILNQLPSSAKKKGDQSSIGEKDLRVGTAWPAAAFTSIIRFNACARS